jgi:hypothetical protein
VGCKVDTLDATSLTQDMSRSDQERRCTAARKREFKLPRRKAGPPNHEDDEVDSDQQIVNKELSLCSVQCVSAY